MKEYQVSYRGNRFVTRDNIIDVLNELGYQPGGGEGGLRLISITSWYKKTTESENVTVDNPENPGPGWQIGFVLPDPTNRYVWKFSDYHYGDPDHEEIEGFHIYTNCELVSVYASPDTSMGIDFVYALFDKEILSVTLTDGSGDYPVTLQTPTAGWTRDLSSLAYGADAYLWMSQRRTGEGQTWSIPVRLSGEDGSPGADGLNIQFSYKHMNRLPDSSSQLPEDNPYTQGVSDNEIPDGWKNHPSGVGYFTELNGGVEEEVFYRYEWATYRLRKEVPEGSIIWDPWSSPFIWSAYGEKGMDGDGVEYVYKREWSGEPEEVDHPSEDFIPTVANPTPGVPDGPVFIYGEDLNTGQEGIGQSWNKGVYQIANTDPNDPNNWRPEGWDRGFNRWDSSYGTYNGQGEWVPKGWRDDPRGVDENHKKEYVSQRKRVNGVWGPFSTPTVWATFSKEHTVEIGEDGYWYIDGKPTDHKAEGENGKGIDLKGRVDFLDSDHETRFMQENPNFSFEPGYVVTYLKDVDDETSDNFRDPEIGDCYVVTYNGHIYLYVGGEDADWTKHWQDFGEFQGEGAYVHIAWAENVTIEGGEIHTTGFVLDKNLSDNIAGLDWMGIYTDNKINDSLDATKYKWNYLRGRDGDNIERVYIRTAVEVTPEIEYTIQSGDVRVYPPYTVDGVQKTYQSQEYLPFVANPIDDDTTTPPIEGCQPDAETYNDSEDKYQFTDNPQGVTSTLPYEWMSERKKRDGEWKYFSTPSLHATYSHNGQSVIRSTIFRRWDSLTTAPTKPLPTFGNYEYPAGNPADPNWKDGIPSGTGAIWKTERVFTSDGRNPQWDEWSTPTLVQDDDNYDIELSDQPRNPAPIPPVKYDEATIQNPCNSHHPEEGDEGYDENLIAENQLWYDPVLDADYITSNNNKINWMATRTKYVDSNGLPKWRPWTIILIKGEDGGAGPAGIGFQHAYIVITGSAAPNIKINPNNNTEFISDAQGATGTWQLDTTNGLTVGPEQYLWMAERTVQSGVYGLWGDPVKISGEGTPGKDAEDIEFVYKQENRLPNNTSQNSDVPGNTTYTDINGKEQVYANDDYIPQGWTDSPLGVSTEFKYEWMCQRIKPRTGDIEDPDNPWGPWSNVFVWSAYGDTGMDGDGIEYVYTRTSNPTKPNRPRIQRTSSDDTYINWDGGVENTSSPQSPIWEPKDYIGDFYGWIGGEYNSQGEWVPEGWTDDPQGVGTFPNPSYVPSDPNSKENIIYYKEYVSQRKRVSGVWGDFSDPAVWSTKAQQFHIENGNWVDEEGNIIGQAEGDQGQGIQLKGTVDVIYDSQKGTNQKSLQEINPKLYPALYGDIQPGDCYVVRANRHLYVCLHDTTNWNRDRESADNWEPTLSATNSDPNWEDVGEFQGEPGQGSYMHIAWASSNDRLHYQTNNIVFTNGVITEIKYYVTAYEDKDPQTEYDWMGVLTDHEVDDLDSNYGDVSYKPEDDETWNWNKYKWNHVRGRDGDNYEHVYLRTKTESAPGFVSNYTSDSNYQEAEYLPEVNNYSSSQHSGRVVGNKCTFTDDPVGVEPNWPFEWMAERRKKLDTTTNIVRWFEFSTPALWAKYSFDGNPGTGIQTRYISALIKSGLTITNTSVDPPTSSYTFGGNSYNNITWKDSTTGLTIGATVDGFYYLWMTQRSGYTGNWTAWSTPVRLSGEDGEPGADGTDIEFIYKRSNNLPDPTNDKPGKGQNSAGKTYANDDYVPSGWEDNPNGVDLSHKYEWACQRIKSDGESWSDSTNDWIGPFVWSAYGETGMDGDGVEYVFFRSPVAPNTPIGPRARKQSDNSEKISYYGGVKNTGTPQNPVWIPKDWSSYSNDDWSDWEWDPTAGHYSTSQGEWIPKAYGTNISGDWSDDPFGVTMANGERKEWVSTRKRVNGTWDDFDSPKLWASFGTDIYIDDTTGCWVINGYNTGIRAEGEDGKGVALKGSVHVLSNSEKSDYASANDMLVANVVSLQDVRPNNGNTYSNIAIGDCYVVKKNRYLYTCIHNKDPKSESNPDGWDYTNSTSSSWTYTTNWGEIGEFQGADGDDGVSQFVHIAWTTSDNIIWDSENPNEIAGMTNDIILAYEDKEVGIEYDWMGICRNEYEEDPEDWQEYKWNHVRGKDGSDYEKVYVRTNSESVIPVVNQNTGYSPGHNIKTDPEFWPAISNYADNSSSISDQYFTDDPHGVSAQWPYEWVAERRKTLNSNTQQMEWGNFDPPVLWATYSFDGITAYLTRGSDSVTVDAAGNVVGGYGNASSPRIYTEVKIYDPKKNNGDGTYGGYLTYNSSTTVAAGNFKLSAVGTNCTKNITSTGKVWVNPITDVTKDTCSIAITATISSGKTFNFNFPVTLNHIPQTYLTYTLTNDSDTFTYRTRTQQYDGLPIETCLEVQTTDGTVDSLGDNTLKENGYIKSVTVAGKGETNFLRYARVDGTNVGNDKTITVEADISDTTTISHTTKTVTIYKNSTRTQDTGLRLEIKSDGNIKLYRRTGTADLDLEDTKHDLDISCIAVLGDVEYNSPAKTFGLSEKNDVTLYKLVLSSDTFIKDETGNYSPSTDTFSVKVNVNDGQGTTTVTPVSSNDWLVRENVKVRFINGNPATTPGSDTLDSLSNLNHFQNINNNFFTVVVVEYDSSNQPILYHDAETVDIVPPGISQTYLDLSPTQFIVDCNEDGEILSTANKSLTVTAHLKWGNQTCGTITAKSMNVSGFTTGTSGACTLGTINDNNGEITRTFTFKQGEVLTSGIINVSLTGTFSDGVSRTANGTVIVQANLQGETGPTGPKGDFKSTAFIRTYTNISEWLPTGGNYNSPIPTDFNGKTRPDGGWGWEDGIPAGEETLWSSTATFYGNNAQHTWSYPKIVQDSEVYDVEFALKQPNGSIPNNPVKYDEATSTNKCNSHKPLPYDNTIVTSQIWYDPVEDKDYVTNNYDKFYWKAERNIINNVKGPWVITQIKGESEPNIKCDTPIVVIETDPTGKLSEDSTKELKTYLRLGETVQSPVLTSCSGSSSASNYVTITRGARINSDNSITWTITAKKDIVLSNVTLTITMGNSSCSATKTIDIVFERQTRSSFKSFVFKRFASTPSASDAPSTTATGGSYENNGLPTGTSGRDSGWSDGLPNDGGTDPIYMSSRTFYSDNSQSTSWSTPVMMSDTDNFNVEFSFADTDPGKPGDSGKNWYDPSGNPPSGKTWAEAVWMATSTSKDSNGTWINWIVVRIKGEKGDNGTNGRSIYSITTWYKAFDTLDVTMPLESNDDSLLTGAGWVNSYIKPTKENPYLWKFTRTVYQYPDEVVHDGLEMIQVWSENMINPNLLEDTEFTDINHISAWTQAGKPFNNTYSGTITTGIESNAYNNKNSFYVNSSNCNVSIYMLQQYVTGKIVPSEWYTLSFWIKCSNSGNNTIHVSIKFGNPSTVSLDETSSLNYSNDTTSDQAYIQLKNISNSWSRRTITFKSSDPTSSNYYEYIQFMMLNTTGTSRRFDFCMPKLEIGKVATDYVASLVKDPYPRLTVWGTGKQYYRGNYGEPYLDAVTYGTNWFRCRNTHISSNSNKPVIGQTTAYWEPAQNLDFIVTDLLLAETGYIKNLVVGGLRTGDRGTAHVEMEGATINFYGNLGTPSIEMQVDPYDGMAYLRFFDINHEELYDLGPNGIKWLRASTSEASWTTIQRVNLTSNNNPDFSSGGSTTSLHKFKAKVTDNVIVGSTQTGGSANIAELANGRYFTSQATITLNDNTGDLNGIVTGLYRSSASNNNPWVYQNLGNEFDNDVNSLKNKLVNDYKFPEDLIYSDFFDWSVEWPGDARLVNAITVQGYDYFDKGILKETYALGQFLDTSNKRFAFNLNFLNS